jgi:hypothetical protein
MKTLAAQYSISDVGLSKACRRYDIPVPERGYWAKPRAGKKVHRRPLPPRGRQKAAGASFVFRWDGPQFDSPFEKRRLRLLNAIFTALEQQGMKPWVRGREARDLGVQVNDQNVSFSVDDAKAKPVHHPSDYQRPRSPSGRMKVIIKSWQSDRYTRQEWEDTEAEQVERYATDIVVQLIVAGEYQFREDAQHRYEWILKRKAQLIEEARRQKEEAERRERERPLQLEKERIDRLLGDAAALRQARDIRSYVEAMKALCAGDPSQVGAEDLRIWEEWALSQADRIDLSSPGSSSKA